MWVIFCKILLLSLYIPTFSHPSDYLSLSMRIEITFVGISSHAIKESKWTTVCWFGAQCCFSAVSKIHTSAEELIRKKSAILI